MNSESLLDFNSQHFNSETRQLFLQSIYSRTVNTPVAETDENVSLVLSSSMHEMFRFSQEYKKKKIQESLNVQQDVKVIKRKQVKEGKYAGQIQELEKEFHEKSREFHDFHVWPVLPLEF